MVLDVLQLLALAVLLGLNFLRGRNNHNLSMRDIADLIERQDNRLERRYYRYKSDQTVTPPASSTGLPLPGESVANRLRRER